jgi:hypothetical protein
MFAEQIRRRDRVVLEERKIFAASMLHTTTSCSARASIELM